MSSHLILPLDLSYLISKQVFHSLRVSSEDLLKDLLLLTRLLLSYLIQVPQYVPLRICNPQLIQQVNRLEINVVKRAL